VTRPAAPADQKTVATSYRLQLGDAALARCQLAVIEGPDQGRALALGEQAIVIGSGADCQLVLTDDRVSQRHLQVARESASFCLVDLGSRNGTWYEGARIGETRVGPGAVIKLGRSLLRFEAEPQPLAVRPSQARRLGELVGESLAMREVFAVLELVAASDVTVLIEGETGTGKEAAARAIHDAGPRRRGPFVAVDCGALPPTLLESELFGHVKGAFTGAANARSGAFMRADQGTLFLDELGAVSPAVQAALLRAIETRCVRPVGADSERPIDVQVIAASQVDLRSRVADGSFRADLYYRLAVVRVQLPPLRNRREDLPLLVAELLQRRGFATGAIEGPNLDRLTAHGWPGNVRELRNTIDRAIALSPGASGFGELTLSLAPTAGDETLPLRTDLAFAEAKQLLLEAFERRYLRDAHDRCGENLSAMARAIGVDRKHLRTLLRRHRIID